MEFNDLSDYLTFLFRRITLRPDDARLQIAYDDDACRVAVQLSPCQIDSARLIGAKGANIRALRYFVTVACERAGFKSTFTMVNPPPGNDKALEGESDKSLADAAEEAVRLIAPVCDKVQVCVSGDAVRVYGNFGNTALREAANTILKLYGRTVGLMVVLAKAESLEVEAAAGVTRE